MKINGIKHGLDNLGGNQISEGISVVCAIKNRNESLSQSIPTWLVHKEINEIVILDWDSDEDVKSLIDSFNDKRIKYIRVNNEPKWILSHALNLGIQFSTYDKIIKLDTDIKIRRKDFFKGYRLAYNNFYTGNWELSREPNDYHLNGVLFCNRRNFMEVNGYNENIVTYGWDDTDLYNRLSGLKLNKKNILPRDLYHIPHDNNLRVKHQDIKHLKNKNNPTNTDMENITTENYNRFGLSLWGTHNNISDFKITKISEKEYVCERIMMEIDNYFINNRFPTLKEVEDTWIDHNDINKLMYNKLHIAFKKSPALVKHRSYVMKHSMGFGEDAFHYMWSIIMDDIHEKFDKISFLEIGVYKGQVLSLVPYICKLKNYKCSFKGVTPLSSVGDKYSYYPPGNYKELLKQIFDNFEIPFTIEENIIHAISESYNATNSLKNEKFNVVYVDGSHEYKNVVSDFNLADKILDKGGYVVFGDSSLYLNVCVSGFNGHKTVSDAVRDTIEKNENYKHVFACGHNRVFRKLK